MRPATPWPAAERASAPPRWRICVVVSGEPEPSPTWASSAVIVSSSRSETYSERPQLGIGSTGSIASRPRSRIGYVANVCRSGGASSTSGRTSSRPAASSPS